MGYVQQALLCNKTELTLFATICDRYPPPIDFIYIQMALPTWTQVGQVLSFAGVFCHSFQLRRAVVNYYSNFDS